MESNHQCSVPTNSNGEEQASNIQGALTLEEVLSKESYGPVISYHRRYPDGEYVPVILSEGYGFNPQDDQLIVDYLNKEINKEDAPYIRIPNINVYNHTPEELAESHQSMGKDEWYFFSPRERKYFNGSRPNRAAGNGFWKATGADKRIYRNGKSVGSKKCLVFYHGKPKQSNKTTWIMHEYVADQPQRQRLPNDTGDMRLDDCVLCRIYKKSEYSPKEEKEAAASQSGETAKSSENKKQAALKHVKTEHEGTNQQQNIPVIQPSLQGALTPEESYGPNNKPPVISYHKIYPDGEYVPVILSEGYGFIPQDDQLIVDYLNKEINKEDAPYIRIPKINIYNHTPVELAESHQSMGKDEWYFFSPRERKYFNGSRPNRAAGNGFWKATGADKRIYRNGKSVGSKKCLVFYQGKPKQSNKTTWIMHEYVADQPQRQRLPNGTGDMRLDDCVLCRIHKKSEYSPKEEKEAAASQSGETVKSSENKKQAAPKPVKTEHEGTNQQHNIPVIQPSLPIQQQNLRVLQPNLSMPQQNQQAIHYGLQQRSYNLCGQLNFPMQRNPEEAPTIMQQPNVTTPLQNPQAIMQNSLQHWSYNHGGQLDFNMERNPEEAQRIMLQANLTTPQQNPQAITQYSPQPWSYNHGGQLDFHRESNPEEAKPLMLEPNFPTQQQNLQATQCSLRAGSQNLGEQFDFPMESILEQENQFYFNDLGNSHENFGYSIPMDRNQTFPPVFQNGFNDFYHLPPMDSFDPIPPSLGNNDHPQNGSLIQGDELVFPKAGTSGNA